METQTIPGDEHTEEVTPDRLKLAASTLHRREREAYGGSIQWEAAFFGWLSAIGLAALLVAMAIGAGVAVGLTEIEDTAKGQTDEISAGGSILLVAILALAYLTGGYVAGRMARFDGWRQGLGVWLLALLMTLALAITAAVAGGEINPLEALDLPRIPIEEEGGLTTGGAIALALTVLATLGAALAGGHLGERFHRAIDAAGIRPHDEIDVRDAGEPREARDGDEGRGPVFVPPPPTRSRGADGA
jgi:hypothetical protein